MTYPASINIENIGPSGAGGYQKSVRVQHPSLPGGEAILDPGFVRQLTVTVTNRTFTVSIADWASGYPDGSTPLAPLLDFRDTVPTQKWHGAWSDAPLTHVPIAALGHTQVSFSAVDDARTLTVHVGA